MLGLFSGLELQIYEHVRYGKAYTKLVCHVQAVLMPLCSNTWNNVSKVNKVNFNEFMNINNHDIKRPM